MANSNQRSGLRLGFIGMGAMGSRMANRLLAAHYDLTVCNRTRERTRPLQQRGAKVATTPKGLAAEVDVVLSCVANDAALADVMCGPDGALQAARPGTIFIELSTVSPPHLQPAVRNGRRHRRLCPRRPSLRQHAAGRAGATRHLRGRERGGVQRVQADP